MRLSVAVALSVAILSLSCDAGSGQGDPQDDWHHVLNRKKAALSASASPHQKQVYADTLSAFVQKHPTHGRARAVYQRIQLDFASELLSIGRYQDAIRCYRSVLTHDPSNEEAVRGVSVAVDRLAVSRQKLLSLEKGMSQRQVAQILGKPIPGWTVRKNRRDASIESWYYRTTEGKVAGVYFRDGVVFAAEATSNEKTTSLR